MQQSLRPGRAARHVHVDRDELVDALGHGVGVPVWAAAVGARAEADDVLGLGHLVVQALDRGCHLVGDRARHHHEVGLPRPVGERDHAQPDEVVAAHRCCDELDGAARQPEVEHPEGVPPAPVEDVPDRFAQYARQFDHDRYLNAIPAGRPVRRTRPVG